LLFEADNLALAPLRSLPKGILYEKSFNLKTISEGDFGHFRENNLIILSKVAKIAVKIVFKSKLFLYKIIYVMKWSRTS